MEDPIAPPLDSGAVNNIAATSPAPPAAAGGMGGAPGSQPVPVSTAADNTSSLLRSGMGAPPQQSVSNSATTNAANNIAPPVSPEAQRAQHWAAIGAGYDTMQKATDPNQSQPGSIWRTILSAALVGAAAGAGHGWKGAGEGAKAWTATQDRQQKLRQQAFENERQNKKDALEQNKDKREQGVFDQKKIMDNAQLGLWNIQKLQHLNDLHGKSYAEHKGMVADAAPIIAGYKAMGNNPSAQNIPETEHQKWLQEHPGDSTADWQPAGVVSYTVKDPDGQERLDYQTVWNKYDKTKDMVIVPDLLKRMKDSGALDSYPEGSVERALKPGENGQTLPYNAFVSLMNQTQTLENEKFAKQTRDDLLSKNQKELAKIEEETKAARLHQQSAQGEITLHSMAIDQAKNETSGGLKLAKAGNDWEKADLTPAEIYALQPKVEKDIAAARALLGNRELIEAVKDKNYPGYAEAQKQVADAFERLHDAQSHSILFRTGKPTSAPAVANPLAPIVAKHVGDLDPEPQATVSILVKGNKNLSSALTKLNEIPMPDPTRKKVVAALQNIYAEAKPILDQQLQEKLEATAATQGALNQARREENPMPSADELNRYQ